MIDRNSQFMAILTNVGAAKLANANALGIPWNLTMLGVGDANGTDPVPSATQTKLINERLRAPLNQLRIDPVNSAVIIAEQVIPADIGGWWIREMGLYDADGDLVAVANCAPSFKPALDQGSGRTQIVRMNFIVSSTGNITLKIDPSIVLATREYVDQRTPKKATQELVDAGADDATYVTPKGLSWGVKWLKSGNGFVALPPWLGGFVFQWGQLSGQGGVDLTVRYPIAFPNYPFFHVATVDYTPGSTMNGEVNCSPLGRDSFFAKLSFEGGTSFRWFSVGF